MNNMRDVLTGSRNPLEIYQTLLDYLNTKKSSLLESMEIRITADEDVHFLNGQIVTIVEIADDIRSIVDVLKSKEVEDA